MSSILQACIEEGAEDFDNEIFEILLKPMLKINKDENVASCNLVQVVLRRTSACINTTLSKFINDVLVGSAASDQETELDLSTEIYTIIYELHEVAPDLLTNVLPSLCAQLIVEEEEVRFKAVQLLGQLFASTTTNLATHFDRDFKDFLGRFLDKSTRIRLEMLHQGALILKRKRHVTKVVQLVEGMSSILNVH